MARLHSSNSARTSVLQRQAAGPNWQPAILTWYDPALGGTNSSSGTPEPHGLTASGESYDPNKDTCAAPPNYAFGTEVTFNYNGRMVTCRVNDRGGAIQGNHFDLSRHAAETLGIIQSGRVGASFAITGQSGAPAAANAAGAAAQAGAATGGGLSGGPDILTILGDIATLNISDLAVQLALAGVTVIKDVTLGVADFIVIPFWQWNQRAVQYYLDNELFSNDPNKWTVTFWTAGFWGLGYWLLWTEPGSGSLKPAPVRHSRLARHTRSLQAIPARRSLTKPKNVESQTLKKPKPVVSRARVTQTGTMRATRHIPVRVSGEHVTRRETESRVPVRSAGSVTPGESKLHKNTTGKPPVKPNAQH